MLYEYKIMHKILMYIILQGKHNFFYNGYIGYNLLVKYIYHVVHVISIESRVANDFYTNQLCIVYRLLLAR